MDLHRQFAALAGPEVAPTAEQIDADLHRGRRALRKRRTVQTIAGSAFAVAALAAGVTVVTDNPAAPPRPGSASAATRLVAYAGAQPKGYTIDKVPDGWEIQADTPEVLMLAPKNAADQDPRSFVGKIGIMLRSKDQRAEPQGTKVKVGDKQGVLVKEPELDPTTKRLHAEAEQAALAKGGPSAAPFLADKDAKDDGGTLWVKQPNGVHLLVQFWDGLGLSQQDKLDIAAGIHVHKDAVQSVG